MSVQWRELPDSQTAAETAADFILDRLAKAIGTHGRATIALAGGATPKILFQRLATLPFAWDRVHFFWADERVVPPDHPDSNYRMARELLLDPLRIPEGQVHRILGEFSPDEASEKFVEDLRTFFGLQGEEQPSFDVIHLGLGADGHTASLFPGEPLIENRSRIAAAVLRNSNQSWRVTLLPGTLIRARDVVFFTPGAEKAEAIHGIRTADYNPLRYPPQLINRYAPGVTWFLDRAAAKTDG